MTDSDMNDNGRLKANHRALRKIADRIARGEEIVLSADDQLEILGLTHELEQTRYALDSAEMELEAKSEQLQRISRELEASGHDFYALAESIPVAFIVLDKKGIVESANTRARQMLAGGFKPIIGLAFSSFVAPEDLATYLRQIKIRPRNKNRSFSFELRMRDFAARTIHVHGQVSARHDAEGGLLRWHLAFFDVTEQKRLAEELRVSREHLAIATEAAHIGVWDFDVHDRTSYWNEELYRLLGLEPCKGPEDGNRFFEFIHPEDRKGGIKNMQTVVEMAGDHIDLEFRIVRADGQIRWLASRGRIFRDDHKEPVRISGINFDITEKKQTEEMIMASRRKLKEQLAETEKINRELTEYAYAVSHDLKTPLRAAGNYASFLYEDLVETLKGEQKKYLEGMKKALSEGEKLINDLLDFSRIGQSPIDLDSFDVPGVVKEALASNNLSSEVEVEVQQKWPEFRADRTMLLQIMRNLITNGVKFNKRNPKRIEIGCCPLPQDKIEIFVRDNGIGIEPEYHDQIFRIFQRLHTSSEYVGTGIGLAIVKKAVERLNGSIRLESTPGQGSTFFVKLPRRPEAEERESDHDSKFIF